MDFAKEREISLLDIVQKNQILFIHLPTEGKSIQSSRIGRLLTQEIILISGLRKSYPMLNQAGVFSIFIDEFDAFATESFITFLNKGRSSNFMIHIAHQTISDLKRVSPDGIKNLVVGRCVVSVKTSQLNRIVKLPLLKTQELQENLLSTGAGPIQRGMESKHITGSSASPLSAETFGIISTPNSAQSNHQFASNNSKWALVGDRKSGYLESIN